MIAILILKKETSIIYYLVQRENEDLLDHFQSYYPMNYRFAMMKIRKKTKHSLSIKYLFEYLTVLKL